MSRRIFKPTVLTVAGSDSSGGAGIQADLKTFAAHDVYGVSAITAVTAQNTLGVTSLDTIACPLVQAQITAVFDDFDIKAIKTGMLASAEIVDVVCSSLEAHPTPPLVVDPVMISTSGDRLLDNDAVKLIRTRLMEHARVVTPNRTEAELLAGLAIESLDDARRATSLIRAQGAAAVVITGGHFEGNQIVDLLDDGGTVTEFSGPRIESRSTHGTGCSFAASVAAGLAQETSLVEAVEKAKHYVEGAIKHAQTLGHGQGPINHFWRNERQ
jgi:hydroxymethylpyrimidine/phosphomethylpyrimidine kinase